MTPKYLLRDAAATSTASDSSSERNYLSPDEDSALASRPSQLCCLAGRYIILLLDVFFLPLIRKYLAFVVRIDQVRVYLDKELSGV